MFERFTHAAREAVVGAQQEARELRQSPIGTQHVLLSMLAAGDSAVARALAADGVDHAVVRAEIVRRMPDDAGPDAAAADRAAADRDAEDREALKAIGIDLDKVRQAIEDSFGPGALHLPRSTAPKRRKLFGRFYASGHSPFSPRNKKVLELSLREAIRLKHNYIAPEHIALGMIREGEGLAVQILVERGVDLDRLRETLTRSLNDKAA